jgi:ubiquinone biosynthesis protein UbiJ
MLKRLETALNRTLKLDPDTLAALAELSGKALAFEFSNTGLAFTVFPAADGVRLESGRATAADVCIRGTPTDLLAYLLAASGKGEGYAGRLDVSGDVNLAQRFQAVMKNVDLDWEEYLSSWFGDTLAHKLGNAFRGSLQFAKNTRRTLELDVSEYLRYEKEILPDQGEVNGYITAIDALRDDAERLKLRVERLARVMPD